MSSAASIAVICPQEIRSQNHKIKTGKWWQDPKYRALSEQFLKDIPVCEYCGGKSTVVHHDNADSYRSQEEYFKPENFTAACFTCHSRYRSGYVICPICRQHYMKRGSDECRWCRGMPFSGRKLKKRTKPSKHICDHRFGQQQCHRDGRVFICTRSSKTAPGCDHFLKREAVHG
jgi:hypothetical protein